VDFRLRESTNIQLFEADKLADSVHGEWATAKHGG
jgi:hypothetical protein